MIELIVPDGVAVQTLSNFQDYPLFPDEVRSLGNVVEKRRVEFATGRQCAKQAMLSLGRELCPIPIGPGREPQWPVGLTGSITHCPGYCAAAVTDANRMAAIGIDAEENLQLPNGVLDVIATQGEQSSLSTLPASHIHWDRLLFSAKESVFKAWYAITHQWLDFEECSIAFILPSNIVPLKRGGLCGDFTALLSRSYSVSDASYSQFQGKYCCSPFHLATVVAVNNPSF